MTLSCFRQFRRGAGFLVSLSALAVLSACGGGGEEETDWSAYLPNFAAPAPIDIANLTLGRAIVVNVDSILAGLLGTAKYQDTAAGLAWVQSFDPSVPSSSTNNPLETSGAAFAHATNLTGAGEIIAFSDAHVSEDHDAIGASRLNVISNGTTSEHGTSVVSVAMGNSADFIGVAPNATGIYGTFEATTALTAIGIAALNQGAVAWNNSWGYTNIGLNASGFNAAFDDPEGQAYLNSLLSYADVGVVVFAVDNDDSGVAGLMDGLPVLQNNLEAGWIAVANGIPTFVGGAVDSVYLLSSACYESARWCVVADGSWRAATGSGSTYSNTTGSSFATPQVSGALAILAEAFPFLTPHELRIRLLASAEDDFFQGDATVELADGYFKRYSVLYGHGFLDIEAALRPIGPTAMAMAEGTEVSTESPILKAGTGFGDAVELSLTGTNVAVKDALEAGFCHARRGANRGCRPAIPRCDAFGEKHGRQPCGRPKIRFRHVERPLRQPHWRDRADGGPRWLWLGCNPVAKGRQRHDGACRQPRDGRRRHPAGARPESHPRRRHPDQP